MYEYIKGTVTALQPATAVIETAAGVAYSLNISLNTYPKLKEGIEAKLLVHLAIREDAWVLYGFASEDERSMFRLLIGVSGVGAATARIVLSSYTPADLQGIISNGEVKTLKAVKGIGAKTAERIIVDLRDKVGNLPGVSAIASGARRTVTPENYDEALAALIALGFTKAPSQKVLDKLFGDDPALTIEQAIRRALPLL